MLHGMLRNELFGEQLRDPGLHTILSPVDDKVITGELSQIARCRFLLISHDASQLVAKYFQKQRSAIKEEKNYNLGPHFVANYVSRNN